MGFSLRDRWLAALAYPPAVPAELPSNGLTARVLVEMLDRADRHGVLPAVLMHLKALAAREGAARAIRVSEDRAAQAFAEALRPAERRLLIRSAQALRLRFLAREVCAALGAAGVAHQVLKGSDFADRLYEPPALRTYTDVDVLVPFAKLDAAGQVLRGLGYEPREPAGVHAADYAECAWCRRGSEGTIEIHWNVVHSPSLRRGISLAYEDLQWEGPGRVTPGALLLIAVVHAAASHGFDRLGPLCDIALAARRVGASDVEWLGLKAQGRGLGLALLAALRLAGALFPEPACGRLIERLCLPTYRWLRCCLSPGMVLRLHARRDSFRRQGFRQMLKNR